MCIRDRDITTSHSPTKFLKFLQPTISYLISFVQSACKTRSSSAVTLYSRPSVSSSLQITNRSFRYASPHLRNQLPSLFRQPHCVHSPPGSPHPTHITSSQSPPSLSLSITPDSRPFTPDLKLISFANPFLHRHSYFPDCLHGSWTCTELNGHWRLF